MSEENKIDIMSIKDGFNHINVLGRVLDVWNKREVKTSRGDKEVSEVMIGDSSGRIKVVLWGDKAGALKKGEVVLLKNTFTTKYRGELQLNVGDFSTFEIKGDQEAPEEEAIPRESPKLSYRGGRFGRGERDSHADYRRRRWKRLTARERESGDGTSLVGSALIETPIKFP